MKTIATVMALAAVLVVLSAAFVAAMTPHRLVADPNFRPIAKSNGVISADSVGTDMGPRKYSSAVGVIGVDMGPRRAV